MPLLGAILCSLLLLVTIQARHAIADKGTPANPTTFFVDEVPAQLTALSRSLIDVINEDSLRILPDRFAGGLPHRTYHDRYADAPTIVQARATLEKHGFSWIQVVKRYGNASIHYRYYEERTRSEHVYVFFEDGAPPIGVFGPKSVQRLDDHWIHGPPIIGNEGTRWHPLCDHIHQIHTLPIKGEPVADEVYRRLVSAGSEVVPCLIEKLLDMTPMEDPRQAPKYSGAVVGDVAYFVLVDITGVPFVHMFPDELKERYAERGVYAYFEFVEDRKKRKVLQERWRRWLAEGNSPGHPTRLEPNE